MYVCSLQLQSVYGNNIELVNSFNDWQVNMHAAICVTRYYSSLTLL